MAMRTAFGVSLLALAIVSVVSRDGLAVATAQHDHQPATAADAQQKTSAMMMKMHDEMMAEMKAEDAKLDALASDMNKATGEARITAMTALLNEMVRQHKGMHARMGEMQGMMGGRSMMRGR